MPQPPQPPPPPEYEKEIRALYRERNTRAFATPGVKPRRVWGELIITVVLALTAAGAASVMVFSFLQPVWLQPVAERPVRSAQNSTGEIREDVAARLSGAVVSVLPARTPKSGQPLADQTYLASEALGQGVVLSSDGWLVTTQAVVDGSQSYVVAAGDGAVHTVEQVVLDPVAPLAYLKVTARNLTPTAFVDSADLRLGETVAVGARDAQSSGASWYIRQLVHVSAYQPASRADLVVSSETLPDRYLLDEVLPEIMLGAPVINLQGDVIGLAASFAGQVRAVVPLDNVGIVMDGLFASSEIHRPLMGVHYSLSGWLSPWLPSEAATSEGALVTTSGRRLAVLAKTPAAQAGLKEGDVVQTVAGERVGSRSLSALLQQYRPGTEIELTVVRQGKELMLKLKLGELVAEVEP